MINIISFFGGVQKKIMQDIISNFTQTLVDIDYFDIKDPSGKIFYKSSRLRNSEWYAKTKLAHELLEVEKQLEELVDEFYCNQLLVETLKNKTTLVVHSMPNTKFTMLDIIFCLYIKSQNSNLTSVTLKKHVPVDEQWFVDPPPCDEIEIEVINSERPARFIIDIEGHRLVKGDGGWS